MTFPFYIRNTISNELIAVSINIRGELDSSGWAQLADMIPHIAKQQGVLPNAKSEID